MTHILHIDTSGSTGSVMLAADGVVIASVQNLNERDHAGSINQMVEDVLKKGNVGIPDLGAIAVCSGPGSYTGLRIGMATAKGLCYAYDLPLILNSKLELLFEEADIANNTHLKLVVLPARIGEYFMAAFDINFNCAIQPHLVTTGNLIKKINEFINNGVCLYGVLGDDLNIPLLTGVDFYKRENIYVKGWAHKTFNQFLLTNFSNLADTEPTYLKSVYIQNSKLKR